MYPYVRYRFLLDLFETGGWTAAYHQDGEQGDEAIQAELDQANHLDCAICVAERYALTRGRSGNP